MKEHISNQSKIDPVCGMTVDSLDEGIHMIHKNQTYYFCAKTCRDRFESNPDKYMKITREKPKGWWGRYLDRLNKATGGKPPSCCQ